MYTYIYNLPHLVVHLEDPVELLLGRSELRRLYRHHVLHKVKLAALVVVEHLQFLCLCKMNMKTRRNQDGLMDTEHPNHKSETNWFSGFLRMTHEVKIAPIISLFLCQGQCGSWRHCGRPQRGLRSVNSLHFSSSTYAYRYRACKLRV